MKFLLTSLTTLSIAAGGLTPVFSSLAKNENNINFKQETMENATEYIPFDKTEKISTDQNERNWYLKFNWVYGGEPRKVQFHGGGLDSYSAWGSSNWHHKWETLDLIADGSLHWLQNDTHWSGLAKQETTVRYSFSHVEGIRYKLSITFSSISYNSFTGSWGNLVIGDGLTFIGD